MAFRPWAAPTKSWASAIQQKFEVFGFDAVTINGRDESAINAADANFKVAKNGKPKVTVANSVKGKGVSFMENNNIWHYIRLNDATYSAALQELDDAA